jgi:uncharacterized Tic20 family protein
MGNEQPREAPSNRPIIIVVSVLAALVVVALIIGAVVSGVQQRREDEQVDHMVKDRLNSCFDSGDC